MPASGYPRQESGVELSLPRDVEAPWLARNAVGEMCRALGLDDARCGTLLLLVSEVVSNAVLHSSGHAAEPIVMTAAVGAENVRITVTDAGEGFTPGERDPTRTEGGYGLYLLEKASSRWGVEPGAPTSVWFELDLEG